MPDVRKVEGDRKRASTAGQPNRASTSGGSPGKQPLSPGKVDPGLLPGADIPRAQTTGGIPGARASEPPFSDAELGRTQDVCEVLYGPLGAHARGTKIHNGPIKLRASMAQTDRTTWVADDKQYSPYMVFSNEKPLEEKGPGPTKLWLPRELHEPKKKGVVKGTGPLGSGSGPKYAYKESDIKRSNKKLARRPRWDQEHHIMVSQSNEEVQKFVREYFDKPVRKESEGIPKVRELYSMNDRQSGWWDEASPLGLPKHTYLDVLGPWNVGGPKEQQKVSYWRKMHKAESAPVLKAKITDSRSNMSLTERLADMPAKDATKFWREWTDQSKNRLPKPVVVEEKKEKRGKKGKRGGWPAPGEPQADEPIQAAVTLPAMMVGSAPKEGPQDWNERWSVLSSKDNLSLTMGQRMYFKRAEFLSGAEIGRNMSYD